ncbi:hypothetical protein [Nostoc sp. CALU 1950]|uniref:hypothetical protein n=1 Tax=Nostoc sp. CALU 1950 TaxID=3104321 RepID=UPI003EC0C381
MTPNESNYSDVVEVNGVSFQTEIQSIILTPPVPWAKKTVRLGIHVTNKTAKCLYFERLDSLARFPNLIDDSGNVIEIDSDILRLWVEGEPYYLVQPGESTFFSLETFLCRKLFNLHLKIYNEAGGFMYFNNLKHEKYKLQIFYRGTGQKPILPVEESNSVTSWCGEVTIPFVDFCIGN